jgi:preprotein translocase subunit SecD
LGYEKAQSAIIDANLTTMITAVILFAMGSGPVRGFAITLGLGIITSVFTAIFVTRLIILIWYERRRPKILEV